MTSGATHLTFSIPLTHLEDIKKPQLIERNNFRNQVINK